jgi:RNA polymerase sigma-70 factor (ECF subfamily)
LADTFPSGNQLQQIQVQAIYDEFADGLKRFLLGVLKDPAAVEDACQLTFLKLIEKGHLVQQQSSIKAWLYQVAFNEAMLVKRRQATGQKHQESLGWFFHLRDQDRSSAVAHDVELLQREERAGVRAALDKLSEVQREVVRMRIYEGKKFREIAEALGIPLATVLTRMQSSIQKLKPLLSHIHDSSESD